ncbi:MAG: pyruvate kinase [Candidatus Magasanikbacteria bacterium]
MYKHTKIVATIGPACADKETLIKMIEAGMNVARLNFSHGTYDQHAVLIKNIREAEKITGEPIAIMQDLQGPRIRLGILPDEGVVLKTGEIITFDFASVEFKSGRLPVNFSGLEKDLIAGQRILIDDGRIETKIVRQEGSLVHAEVMDGGIVFSHKGLNFPDSILSVEVISPKDKADLSFGLNQQVDMVALSFVRNAQDILDLRFLIKKLQIESKADPLLSVAIVAKIERHEAVDQLNEILEAADGVMVARGDLGLEMPAAEVPLVQKKIIDQANIKAKPVIVATQLLDSMQEKRRPTRAEVSDVANAVIDHADALMLSNETAAGKNPVLTVKTMSDIIVSTEKSAYDDTNLPARHKHGTTVDIAIAELSRVLAEEVKAKFILAASLSGETGRLISHVRPNLPIMVATNTVIVQRQLNLSWGVVPFILPPCKSIEELVERSISYVKQNKFAKLGDKMIIVAGEPVGQAGNVNLVEVREVK